MIILKWDCKKHIYEKCTIPENWNCKTYSDDMDEIVNCPHCGKELSFGETYTSMEFHTEMGFGYGVCENCYQIEMKRRYTKEE